MRLKDIDEAGAHRAVATWGRLDIFYANAGVPQPQSSIAGSCIEVDGGRCI